MAWKKAEPVITPVDKKKEHKAEIVKHTATIEGLKKTIKAMEDRLKNIAEEIKEAHRGALQDIQNQLAYIKERNEFLDKKNSESVKLRKNANWHIKNNLEALQRVEAYQLDCDARKHRTLGEIKRKNDAINARQKEQDDTAREQAATKQDLVQRNFRVTQREEAVNVEADKLNSRRLDLNRKENTRFQMEIAAKKSQADGIERIEQGEKLKEEARVAMSKAVTAQKKADKELTEARAKEELDKSESIKLAAIAREQSEQEDYLKTWETANKREEQRLRKKAEIYKKAGK